MDRLIKVERERKMRSADDRLTGYTPSKKQESFHKCPKRNRWIFGGNRSGKSECGAAEAVYWARGRHPYGRERRDAQIWVVSPSAQVQRDVAQSKILKYLSPRRIADVVMIAGSKNRPDSGVIDFIAVKNDFGGISRIGFRNCEQGREKFQGASLDAVWFDEEPPRDIYEECRMRVLDRKGEIWCTMTPLKGRTWVYDEIYLNADDPEIAVTEMEWADNPHLDPTEIELLSRIMDAEELQSRRYGKFGAAGGLVYPEFDSGVHVIEPFRVPAEWYDNISIDPGLTNPLSAHWYAVDFDGNVYVVAEHYEADRDVAYHSERIKAISRALNWHADSRGRFAALIDSAAGSRTLAASKSVCELFIERDILVNPRVDKDLFSGVQRVKNYLRDLNGKPRLFIFSSCVNLIREIKGYAWGNGEAPKKKDDHALDELRYYLASRPRAHEEKNKSEIALDKERLYRELRRERKVN
ncbi:DNA packaging protein [Clostridia bacterium]|nr:DNA packaging protein [Clostridia bacterium]